ncbi:MAG: acyltransferase family protein [Alphaproteobacteria bacterium]|jgi:glucan biosynthesis protein C|nr:acyltransferase family protein [Alphaproteobacteria bacterium]MDB5740085.1 acyltransferase family protein [Alphaproteobacteria bacterium]
MTRKYQLDWLRVLAFALLIPFHVGMLYVSWAYPLKSPRLIPGLEWGMLLLTPWRMALVFVISGVASRHLIGKLGAGRFAADRLRRLLPVILVGMLVINAPQSWVEAVAHGTTHLGFLDYWPSYLKKPRWDHLWFLAYLLPYGLLFALAWKLRAKTPSVALAWLLLAPAVWLAATGMLADKVWPRTDALVNDWGQHLKWLGLFGFGAAVAMRADFWDWILRRRRLLLAVAIVLGTALLADHALWLRGALKPPLDWTSYDILSGLFGWAALLAICGYAARYLNRPSALLSYANTAILPVYVLHQPILIAAAWLLFPHALPLPLEAALLAAVTAILSVGIYHLMIRPFGVMRLLFGLK